MFALPVKYGNPHSARQSCAVPSGCNPLRRGLNDVRTSRLRLEDDMDVQSLSDMERLMQEEFIWSLPDVHENMPV